MRASSSSVEFQVGLEFDKVNPFTYKNIDFLDRIHLKANKRQNNFRTILDFKDMHIQILISDKSLNKYFENATLSVKQKLHKTLRNEICQFNKNRQASNVNAAKQEEQN